MGTGVRGALRDAELQIVKTERTITQSARTAKDGQRRRLS
jgi:hypothetical protein